MLWIENSHSVHEVDAFKRPTAHRLAGPNALDAGLSKKRLKGWILGTAELSTAIAKSALENLLKAKF